MPIVHWILSSCFLFFRSDTNVLSIVPVVKVPVAQPSATKVHTPKAPPITAKGTAELILHSSSHLLMLSVVFRNVTKCNNVVYVFFLFPKCLMPSTLECDSSNVQ